MVRYQSDQTNKKIDVTIISIHKKNNMNSPNNYFGMRFISDVSKSFTGITRTKAKDRESNTIICKEQVGFREQRTTCGFMLS